MPITFTVALRYCSDGKVSTFAPVIRDASSRCNNARPHQRVADLKAQAAAESRQTLRSR